MASKMWFGFQFNLSDSSDDGLYRLDLDPEGQGHQWKMISIQLGSYFGAPKKNSSRGCLRVRPDANADSDADADANRSKTICRPPLKGVDIISTFNFCFLGSVILHQLSTTASSDQHNFGLKRHKNINDILYESSIHILSQ